MKTTIQKITPAIIASRKISIQLDDGKEMVVHPHVVVKKKQGDEILKSMLESGDCMDIPIEKIKTISILAENFAIDTTCLNFDYQEYDLVFPRKADWFE
ncbi:MAG: hypothetical protein ABIR06_23350 [Cyclobacteriaceae bacterium]